MIRRGVQYYQKDVTFAAPQPEQPELPAGPGPVVVASPRPGAGEPVIASGRPGVGGPVVVAAPRPPVVAAAKKVAQVQTKQIAAPPGVGGSKPPVPVRKK